MDNNLEQKNTTEHQIGQDGKDWFLQSLVKMANTPGDGFSIGITLLTHGFLVSGQLISGQKYFKGFADDLASSVNENNNEIANVIKDMVIKVGDSVYGKENADKNKALPTFIHMENAKFFHPNGNPIPGNKGVFWRGCLSEISGFSLGVLSAE